MLEAPTPMVQVLKHDLRYLPKIKLTIPTIETLHTLDLGALNADCYGSFRKRSPGRRGELEGSQARRVVVDAHTDLHLTRKLSRSWVQG